MPGLSTTDWFAIVDTARDERLHPLVQQSSDRTCLIGGELDPALAATSPWLVRLKPGEPLTDVWRQHAPGRGFGITVQSQLSTDALRRDLKRFLTARTPDGTVALFRFYDPVVLLPFLRAASPDQARAFFRDVDTVCADGDAPGTTVTITCSPDGRLAFA